MLKRKRLIVGVIVFLIIVILFVLLSFSKKTTTLKVVSFLPGNGTKEVKIDTTIIINFDRIPTDNEKQLISINLNPKIDFNMNWVGEKLLISPKKGLEIKTHYKVDLNYGRTNISTFSFDTANAQPIETPEDFLYNQAYQEFLDQYPWYAKLPIETSTYRVVYDSVKRSFRIRILTPVSSQQQQTIIDEVLKKLKDIGVTTNPIPYYILTS